MDFDGFLEISGDFGGMVGISTFFHRNPRFSVILIEIRRIERSVLNWGTVRRRTPLIHPRAQNWPLDEAIFGRLGPHFFAQFFTFFLKSFQKKFDFYLDFSILFFTQNRHFKAHRRRS